MLIKYLNIASIILIFTTLITIIDKKLKFFEVQRTIPLPISVLLWVLFIFCLINMIVIPICSVYLMVRKRMVKKGAIYILSAVFFFLFFITPHNWDRF